MKPRLRQINRRDFLTSSACTLLATAKPDVLLAAVASFGVEPTVRVGIVLARDRKSKVEFTPLGEGFYALSDSGLTPQRLSERAPATCDWKWRAPNA